MSEPHLGCAVYIVFVLQQQCCGFDVIFLRSDVQGRQTHTPSAVILQQHCHDLVVTLLEGDGEWGKAVLGTAKETREMQLL